jgi:hypothetical protein
MEKNAQQSFTVHGGGALCRLSVVEMRLTRCSVLSGRSQYLDPLVVYVSHMHV